MSPRRQPCSLYQQCLDRLANLLDVLAQVHKNDLNHPEIVTTLNYLSNYLPLSVQADIGEKIVAYDDNLQLHLLASHLKILLRLKAKKLTILGSAVQSEVLEQEDASHLKRLSLFYVGSMDRAARVCNFLHTAHNLTHLQCTSFCNNAMLGIIASRCRNLYSLDLRTCDVTDEGILRLCGFQEELYQCINSIIENGRPKMKSLSACSQTLKEVKFSMTRITEAGVAVILLALTNIYILRVPDIRMEKVFTFLKTIDHQGVQCNLKEFHSKEVLDEDQLTVLTSLCPNLECIRMSFTGNRQLDSIRLEKLIRLNRLSKAEFADVNTDALMLFLSSRMGYQLRNLFLYTDRTKFSQEKLRITHTHVWNLAKCCPNLRNLSLDGYSLDESSGHIEYNNNGWQFFENLHTLKLSSIKLSDEDLRVFLSKCTSMTTLELVLKDPHVVHDGLIGELLDRGVWKKLSKIKVLNSPITKKSMFRLVNECPSLQDLSCVYSWMIPKDQVAEFKEKARKENLGIDIS